MALSFKNAKELATGEAWSHWFFYGDSGAGKCLGRGTPVLRYDGKIVPVEVICRGDRLMGPDSLPRTVLQTNSGVGPLYRVEPVKGEPWVCNDVHVLTLTDSRTTEVADIPLDEFLKRNPTFRAAQKLFRVGVDFQPAEPLPIDPYFLGLWFGDGTRWLERGQLAGVVVNKPDVEVLQACQAVAASMPEAELYVSTTNIERCPAHRISSKYRENKFLDLMRAVVGSNFDVPHQYLVASREDRLALLAGWLDSDGYCDGASFDWISKRRDYADAIAFLARSLGLVALVRSKEVPNYGLYWRVSISGDCSIVPTRIPRKQAAPRQQRKRPGVTGFQLMPLGPGEFFGFTLDGDGRFLLGDFTVTHNTTAANTFPRPLFIVPQNEQSITTLRGLDVPYYESIDMSSPVKEGAGGLSKILDELETTYHKAPQDFPFDTIVLEGLTHYADLAVEEISAGGTTQMDQFRWGKLSSHLRNVQARLRRLQVHVVFCALAQTDKTENDTLLGKPLIQGQMALKLPSACDVLAYCEIKPSKNAPEYIVHTRQHRHFLARTRFKRLPSKIVDFNFAEIREFLDPGELS